MSCNTTIFPCISTSTLLQKQRSNCQNWMNYCLTQCTFSEHRSLPLKQLLLNAQCWLMALHSNRICIALNIRSFEWKNNNKLCYQISDATRLLEMNFTAGKQYIEKSISEELHLIFECVVLWHKNAHAFQTNPWLSSKNICFSENLSIRNAVATDHVNVRVFSTPTSKVFSWEIPDTRQVICTAFTFWRICSFVRSNSCPLKGNLQSLVNSFASDIVSKKCGVFQNVKLVHKECACVYLNLRYT